MNKMATNSASVWPAMLFQDGISKGPLSGPAVVLASINSILAPMHTFFRSGLRYAPVLNDRSNYIRGSHCVDSLAPANFSRIEIGARARDASVSRATKNVCSNASRPEITE